MFPSPLYVIGTGGAITVSRGNLTKFSKVLEIVCRSEVSKAVFQQLTCASELLVSSCAGDFVLVGEGERGGGDDRGCCESVAVLMLKRMCGCGCR